MISQDQVLDSLRGIIDPDLGRDIVSLGFIKNLVIDGGRVAFTVELTTPACPMKARFKAQCEEAVGALPGVERVEVTMGAMARPQPASEKKEGLEHVDTIIAVSSCKGGVGKSTVAVLLARALQREGLSVGVLDADIYGPSFPTLFNRHKCEVYLKNNLIQPLDIAGMKVMSFGFMLGDSPAVMRGPMVSGYIQQILTQTDWGKLDYLIIDMPPGTGDVQLTITQRAALDGAVIVTTPQALSLVDVAKGILMFERVSVPVLGLVENMSYFRCDGCAKKHRIFGEGIQDLHERFGLPTLAEIPILPHISSVETVYADNDLLPIRALADSLHRAVGARRRLDVNMPVASAHDGHLHVAWPDGTESRLPNALVRASCTCAHCVDEYTGAQLLDKASIPADIGIEEIRPLGNYAVSITWTDGHGSGIFSWEHLQKLSTI